MQWGSWQAAIWARKDSWMILVSSWNKRKSRSLFFWEKTTFGSYRLNFRKQCNLNCVVGFVYHTLYNYLFFFVCFWTFQVGCCTSLLTTQETLKAPMANQASSMISRKPQLFNTTSSSQDLNAGRTGVPEDEERLGYVFFWVSVYFLPWLESPLNHRLVNIFSNHLPQI